MSEFTDLVTAGVTVLTMLGGGVGFVYKKISTRFTKIEQDLVDCKKSHAVHVTVIELLWQEVKRLSPKTSPAVLNRARRLLDQLKEPDSDAR